MPRSTITLIGFDADDTLWQNEYYFRHAQERFSQLLAEHADPEKISANLMDAEIRNLEIYGFGIKGFTLSMIETAVEVTEGRVPGEIIREILAAGRELLAHPVDILPEVQETLEQLAADRKIILITKGDLLDQERKIAQSGLGEKFDSIEIVSQKTVATYRRIFTSHEQDATNCVMVGNSLKSDVLPAIEAGAWGIHTPHDLQWSAEHAEIPAGIQRLHVAETFSHVARIIEAIED